MFFLQLLTHAGTQTQSRVIMCSDECVYHTEQSANCRHFEQGMTNPLANEKTNMCPEYVYPVNSRGKKEKGTCMSTY